MAGKHVNLISVTLPDTPQCTRGFKRAVNKFFTPHHSQPQPPQVYICVLYGSPCASLVYLCSGKVVGTSIAMIQDNSSPFPSPEPYRTHCLRCLRCIVPKCALINQPEFQALPASPRPFSDQPNPPIGQYQMCRVHYHGYIPQDRP